MTNLRCISLEIITISWWISWSSKQWIKWSTDTIPAWRLLLASTASSCHTEVHQGESPELRLKTPRLVVSPGPLSSEENPPWLGKTTRHGLVQRCTKNVSGCVKHQHNLHNLHELHKLHKLHKPSWSLDIFCGSGLAASGQSGPCGREVDLSDCV